MPARTNSDKRDEANAADALGQAVLDSAQKIWLAGLGAFERARAEGPRMFDSLVEQGRGLRDRAREAADEALRTARDAADATAQGRWDRLEHLFEERVSRSLERLGVLTTRQGEELARQVRELNERVDELLARGRRTAGARKASTGGGKRRKTKAPGTRRRVRRSGAQAGAQ